MDFQTLSQLRIPGIKPIGLDVYLLYVCVCVCLDSICWKFVQNLCTCLNDRHCFLVLFRCGVFVWSREQVNANLKH